MADSAIGLELPINIDDSDKDRIYEIIEKYTHGCCDYEVDYVLKRPLKALYSLLIQSYIMT